MEPNKTLLEEAVLFILSKERDSDYLYFGPFGIEKYDAKTGSKDFNFNVLYGYRDGLSIWRDKAKLYRESVDIRAYIIEALISLEQKQEIEVYKPVKFTDNLLYVGDRMKINLNNYSHKRWESIWIKRSEFNIVLLLI